MALEVIGIIKDLVVKCYEVVDEVKSFKNMSKTLAENIKILTEPITSVDETMVKEVEGSKEYERFMKLLEELQKQIEEIKNFLMKLSCTTFLEKTYKKGKIADTFQYYDNRINTLVKALILTFQIEQRNETIQRQKKFSESIEADREEIKNYFMTILADLADSKDRLPENNKIPDFVKPISEAELEDLVEHTNDNCNEVAKLYLATYKAFGEKVAIKRFPEGESVRSSLLEEANLLKKFESPNVVKIWGTCTEGNRNMIVFEYMERGNLRQVLDRNIELTYEQRVRMALDGALALYHIHHLKMIQGSLTSSQFLVDKHFKVKIWDVGLSKTWKSACKLTKSQRPRANRRKYYAPELLESMENPYDYKCEIYCFGIVLWEIMTGKPYDGKSNPEEREKPDTSDLDTSISGLISKCLNDDPVLRPHINEIVRELRRIMDKD